MKKITPAIGQPVSNANGRSDFPELEELIQNCRKLQNVRILRLKQVKEKLGLANSTIYQQISAGYLPNSISISMKNVGWLESEIDAVIQARRFESRSGNKIDIKAFVTALTKPQGS
jgi:prophage regulatory protein